ncbi:MAG: hypothetical protein JNM60_01030, partial [Candidatus Competibacteraceae bacterium]|nr:hypothetical protein [Candidatus Competibacteraceae bacterium]
MPYPFDPYRPLGLPAPKFAEPLDPFAPVPGLPPPPALPDYSNWTPPQPAAPAAQQKPAFDLSNVGSALWEGATQQLVPGFKSALAQAYTGINPVEPGSFAERWMAEGRQAQEQSQARIAELQKAGQTDSSSEAIREAMPSLGYSGVSMLAAIPAGIAGTAATTPIGGALAAGAAAGAAGYRMAGSQFLNDNLITLNEESQKARGRGLTEDERNRAVEVLTPIAQNTGLWEAGPEAIGNAAMFGLGRVALGMMPKEAMQKIAGSAIGRAGVRSGAAAGALGTEVGTEGVTQFHQGNDQQRGQAAVGALLAGQDPNAAMAAVKPQYEGAEGLWQATKDVAPATIATVLMMGAMAKPAHMAYSSIRQRAEGNARADSATQATADLRANLDFAREQDIAEALAGLDTVEAQGRLPKRAAERLAVARQQLTDELALRASPAALDEPMDNARGAAGYLGFADRPHELSDDQIFDLVNRPLPDDAPDEWQEARIKYGIEAKRRQSLNEAAAHFEQNPEAVAGVAKVLGDIAAGKPLAKGAHGSTDYNLASLSDDELTRYRMAGEVLLRDRAEALGKARAGVEQSLELLHQEADRRNSGERRDPQAIREADVAQRVARGAKGSAKLLDGLSPDALERMASGLESRVRLEPGLADTARQIRERAQRERLRLFNPQGKNQPGIQPVLAGLNRQPAPQPQTDFSADRARLSELAKIANVESLKRQLGERGQRLSEARQARQDSILEREAQRRAALDAEIAARGQQAEPPAPSGLPAPPSLGVPRGAPTVASAAIPQPLGQLGRSRLGIGEDRLPVPVSPAVNEPAPALPALPSARAPNWTDPERPALPPFAPLPAPGMARETEQPRRAPAGLPMPPDERDRLGEFWPPIEAVEKLPAHELRTLKDRYDAWLEENGDKPSAVMMPDGSLVGTLIKNRNTDFIREYGSAIEKATESLSERAPSGNESVKNPISTRQKLKNERASSATETRKAEIDGLKAKLQAKVAALKADEKARKAAGQSRAEIVAALGEDARKVRQYRDWLELRSFDAADAAGQRVNIRADGARYTDIPKSLIDYLETPATDAKSPQAQAQPPVVLPARPAGTSGARAEGAGAETGAAASEKQPWEMTLDGWEKDMSDRHIANLKNLREKIAAIKSDLKRRMSPSDRRSLKRTLEDAEQEVEGIVLVRSSTYEDPENTRTLHRNTVKQALSEGKPVPAEVLAEYPDLASTVRGGQTGREAPPTTAAQPRPESQNAQRSQKGQAETAPLLNGQSAAGTARAEPVADGEDWEIAGFKSKDERDIFKAKKEAIAEDIAKEVIRVQSAKDKARKAGKTTKIDHDRNKIAAKYGLDPTGYGVFDKMFGHGSMAMVGKVLGFQGDRASIAQIKSAALSYIDGLLGAKAEKRNATDLISPDTTQPPKPPTPAESQGETADKKADIGAAPGGKPEMADLSPSELTGYLNTTGWSEKGGSLLRDERGNVTGRTKWIARDEWWAAYKSAGKGTLTEKEAKAQLKNAIDGKPLSAGGRRLIEFIREYHADQNSSLAESGWLLDAVDLEDSGFDDLSEQERITAQLQAEASRDLGEDAADTIFERVSTRLENATPEQFNEALRAAFDEARQRQGETGGQQAGEPGPQPTGTAERPLLESYSIAELRAEEARVAEARAERAAEEKAADQKTRADRARSNFVLTGSDRPADVAMAQGQTSMLDAMDGKKGTAQREKTASERLDEEMAAGVAPSETAIAWNRASRAERAEILRPHLKAGFDPGPVIDRWPTWDDVPPAMRDSLRQTIKARNAPAAPVEPLELNTKREFIRKKGFASRARYSVVQTIEAETALGHVGLYDIVELRNDGTGTEKTSYQLYPHRQIRSLVTGAKSADALLAHLPKIGLKLKRKSARAGEPARQSRPSSTATQPVTVAQARTQLVEALGERHVAALERAGRLKIHESDPTGNGAAGFVDGKGVIHLIPGNLDRDALSVALHEGMHLAKDDRFAEGDRAKVRLAHAVMRIGGLKNFIGNPGFSDLVQQVYRMAAEGNPVAVEALNKAKLEGRADPRVDVAEEAVAYLAEYADQRLPLVRRVLAAIRAALYRIGVKVNLTPADVRALALSALKARAKAAGRAMPAFREAAAFSLPDLRRAATLDEAQNLAKSFVGKPLENRSTKLVAVVSNTNIAKMVSQSAVAKSTNPKDHATAIANLDSLFERALLDHSHADARGEPTIRAIHRYVAAMIADNDVVAVKMTVKETTGENQPNPIYSVETIETEKPALEAPEGIEREPGQSRNSPQAGFNENILAMLREVKREHSRSYSQPTSETDAAEQARLWAEFQAVRAQFQAKEAMKTPFRRWFGAGTEGVTARDGKPLTLYHGTNNPAFHRWDASRAGQSSAHLTAGLGFFMTADKRSAARYGSRLLELHAKIDKPYHLTDADLWAIDSVEAATRLRAKLMAKGYDGAVIAAPGSSPYVIAFESKQAKYTSNEEPTDSEDFRYSRPGRPPRMDSPRVAAKVLGDIGELRDALRPGEKAKAKLDPRNWAQGLSDLKSDTRPAWLGLLSQDMLIQLAEKQLPAAEVRKFDDASERMDAQENKVIQAEAFPLAERWQNLMTKDRQQADAMSRLIYMSTWWGVDPRQSAPDG